MVIGNYITKIPRNFYIGIRTPWTLTNDDVWFRTHRLGGRTMMAAGLAMMTIMPFLRGSAVGIFLGTVVGVAALVPIVYSYVIYRRADPSADHR